MTDRIPSDLIRSMAADYEQRHGVPPTHIALPGQDIFDAVPLKNFLVPEDPAEPMADIKGLLAQAGLSLHHGSTGMDSADE